MRIYKAGTKIRKKNDICKFFIEKSLLLGGFSVLWGLRVPQLRVLSRKNEDFGHLFERKNATKSI
jgi:hypothetical protein